MPGFACQVSLDDLERGCVQRIEGNWRRDWTVGAALRNLNARHVLNTGIGLNYAKLCTDGTGDVNMTQTDVAMEVHDMYLKMEKGTYRDTNGKKMKINGEFDKLMLCSELTARQKRILEDVKFRAKNIPGTQECRRGINKLVSWACINYGHAIFCTISPGERHNYLACRLSRYRADDPYITTNPTRRAWCGAEQPSLEPKNTDVFDTHIPGFNTPVDDGRRPACRGERILCAGPDSARDHVGVAHVPFLSTLRMHGSTLSGCVGE